MVEFALILPLLLLLVVGMIQFGLLLFRYQGLQAAAREGGRVAAIAVNDQDTISAKIAETLDGLPLGSTPTTLTVTPSSTYPCQGRSGESVIISITYPNQVDIPLLPSVTKTLTASSEFRCE